MSLPILLSNANARQLQTLGWQSYCPVIAKQGSSTDIDNTDRGDPTLVAERVDLGIEHSRSMFAFLAGDKAFVRDLVSGLSWDIAGDPDPKPSTESNCAPFRNKGTVFTDNGSSITACKDICTSIEIQEGTWVYAYAAAGRSVVAVTNYGDALLYTSRTWCRMRLSNGVFSCPAAGIEPIVRTPRAIQFYSSLQIQGHTLLGQWPTGGIYLFDGDQVRPISKQPPFVTGEPIGYEAQSLAELCGDLYVGYWPTGEIWALANGEWQLAAALFDEPEGTQSFIPFYDREPPTRDQAFYGRRVTALLPFEGSLLATTSNLRDWERSYMPSWMDEHAADQYGAVYRMTRDDCSD